jgi:hypothetical protein
MAKAKTNMKRLEELLHLALKSVDTASSHAEYGSWEYYYLARARDALVEAIRLARGDK